LPLPPSSIVGPGLANPGRLFVNEAKPGQHLQSFLSDSMLGLDLSNDFTSGVATADIDNDGYQDLLIVREPWPPGNSNGSPVLLRNAGNGNHWVGLQLKGSPSNRFGIGARVTLRVNGMCQVQEVYAGTSFASTDSSRLNFGVGSAGAVDSIVVRWPSGTKEQFGSGVAINQINSLVEGAGSTVRALPCSGR
jgi:hypothetical protein